MEIKDIKGKDAQRKEEEEIIIKEFDKMNSGCNDDYNEEKENEEEDQVHMIQTDRDQEETQYLVDSIFKSVKFSTDNSENYSYQIPFHKLKHFTYAKDLIFTLPEYYCSIENGLPWFPYWILNIIEMCKDEHNLSHSLKIEFVKMLKILQHEDGGFCGTTKGISHLISSYAALMAIVNLGIKEAYDIIDIPKMRSYILKMKNSNYENKPPAIIDKKGNFVITILKENNCSDIQIPWPGSFMSQYNGESDLRATYAAMAIASVLNILDDEITEGVAENIVQCQNFEGGIGPEPYCEAHGGYSYCGIASLIILNNLHSINVDNFLRWLVNRQMTIEGGFNGRTNKLVDSCYSFWQGSIFNLLYMEDKSLSTNEELLYDQLSLQAYILICCQSPNGGLFDKPPKHPDLFHTNYAIAGLSCSQKCTLDKEIISLSGSMNFIPQINPIYCVLDTKIQKAIKYYRNLPLKK